MSQISTIQAGSAQFFVQQTAQAKSAAASTANTAQASFAQALNAASSSVGINQPGALPTSNPTSFSTAAKSQISSGTAAIASTDIASSMATGLLNILA